jgi:nucleoid DNA-binding protein
MRKRELAAAIAANFPGVPAIQIEHIIQATMDHFAAELAHRGRLEYRDLGTFTVESYNARKFHIPKTGKTKDLPARKLVRFKPSNTLMQKIAFTV